MRRFTGIVFCLITVFAGAHDAQADTAPIDVVVSFTVLGDFAREVGGARVSVRTLVGPDSDAHVYEPTPADVRAVAGARLVVLNGLGFEGWITRLLDSAQFKGTVVIATTGITPRSAGKHPDPHAWQDPRNAQLYVANIATALVTALPKMPHRSGLAR